MKKKYWLLLSTVFAIMLVLAACGGDDSETSTEKPAEEKPEEKTEEKTNEGGTTAEEQ